LLDQGDDREIAFNDGRRLKRTVHRATSAACLSNTSLPVRFSAGVTQSQFKSNDHDIDACLKRADEAMDRTQQSGQDRVEAQV
jgi:GGDEF domain-containing protein